MSKLTNITSHSQDDYRSWSPLKLARFHLSEIRKCNGYRESEADLWLEFRLLAIEDALQHLESAS